MRRFFLVMGSFIAVAMAACASPTAPSVDTTRCLSGKVPYASCTNKDLVNPWGDLVNPWGDLVNPWGDDSVKKGG